MKKEWLVIILIGITLLGTKLEKPLTVYTDTFNFQCSEQNPIPFTVTIVNEPNPFTSARFKILNAGGGTRIICGPICQVSLIGGGCTKWCRDRGYKDVLPPEGACGGQLKACWKGETVYPDWIRINDLYTWSQGDTFPAYSEDLSDTINSQCDFPVDTCTVSGFSVQCSQNYGNLELSEELEYSTKTTTTISTTTTIPQNGDGDSNGLITIIVLGFVAYLIVGGKI